MNTEKINELKEAVKAQSKETTKGTQSLRQMPFHVGQVLEFVVSDRLEDMTGSDIVGENKWNFFRLKDGGRLAFSQIARIGNGLTFESTNFDDAIAEFLERMLTAGSYSLRITEILTSPNSNGGVTKCCVFGNVAASNSTSKKPTKAEFNKMKMKELKELASDNNIDISDLDEKDDIIERLLEKL